MMKPAAVSLCLSLVLPSTPVLAAPARWSDATTDGLRGLRFEKAVLTQASSSELGDGITLSPGVARILQRVSSGGFTRVADKPAGDAAPLLQFQSAMRSLTRMVAPTVVTVLAIAKPKPDASPDQDQL